MKRIVFGTFVFSTLIVLGLMVLTFGLAGARGIGERPFVADSLPVLRSSDSPRPVFTEDDKPPLVVSLPKETNTGTVTAYYLNIRSKPSVEGIVLGSFETEDVLTILEQSGTWYRVESQDGRTGWVDGEYVLVNGEVLDNSVAKGFTPEERVAYCRVVHCMVTNDTHYTPTPQHIIGTAVMYAPWVMQATAEYSGMDYTGFVGGVAMSPCADIGQAVWLRRSGFEWEGPYLVVDCSGRVDMWLHVVDRHQSVEVDFETAVRWGMAKGTMNRWEMIDGGLENVEVFKGLLPPTESTPVVYRDYFIENAEIEKEPEGNRLWSSAYAEYMNFSDYENALMNAGLYDEYVVANQ